MRMRFISLRYPRRSDLYVVSSAGKSETSHALKNQSSRIRQDSLRMSGGKWNLLVLHKTLHTSCFIPDNLHQSAAEPILIWR